MTTLFLLLNTIVYLLETVKTYELKRTKDKGRDALTPQPSSHSNH